MTTPTSAPVPTDRTVVESHEPDLPKRSRIGWAGIAFAVLIAVGFVLAANSPDYDAPDNTWLEFYADSSNLRGIVIGCYLMGASAFAFLTLAAGLLDRVRETREGSPVLNRIAWGTGLLAAGFIMMSAIHLAGIAGNNLFGGTPDVTNVDLLRENLGVATLVLPGVICAAVFIAISATLARRAGVFGTVMTVYSYLTAFVLLFAVMFVPLPLLPIWGLVAGIALLRKG